MINYNINIPITTHNICCVLTSSSPWVVCILWTRRFGLSVLRDPRKNQSAWSALRHSVPIFASASTSHRRAPFPVSWASILIAFSAPLPMEDCAYSL